MSVQKVRGVEGSTAVILTGFCPNIGSNFLSQAQEDGGVDDVIIF